jgi:hypothetical protein
VDEATAYDAQPASADFCISAPGFNLGLGIRQQYQIVGITSGSQVVRVRDSNSELRTQNCELLINFKQHKRGIP